MAGPGPQGQCSGELTTLAPLASGCPADNEQILFVNVPGVTGGYAFRTWQSIKQCLWQQILGSGAILFTGAQLNGSNQFIPGGSNPWAGYNLLVYYQGYGFLTYNPAAPTYPNSTYAPVTVGGIAGVQILIPGSFGANDLFLVIPNGPQTF